MLHYLLIYLAIAGVLNPLILFHTDFAGRRVTPLQYVKFGLILNVFGFILVPAFSIVHHYKKVRAFRTTPKQPAAPPKLTAIHTDEADIETKQPVDPNSFTSSGNKTVH